jgi:hypothetical protein
MLTLDRIVGGFADRLNDFLGNFLRDPAHDLDQTRRSRTQCVIPLHGNSEFFTHLPFAAISQSAFVTHNPSSGMSRTMLF